MTEPIYTLEDVIKAFEGTGGILVKVAEKLGVTYNTVYNYMQKWPELDEVRMKERTSLCSNLENVVYTSALNGKTEDAKWLLAKLDRPTYGDKTDITITGPVDTRSLDDILGPISEEDRIALRNKYFNGVNSNETNTGSNESK